MRGADKLAIGGRYIRRKNSAYDRIKGEFEKYLQRIYGVERIPVFGEATWPPSIVLVGGARRAGDQAAPLRRQPGKIWTSSSRCRASGGILYHQRGQVPPLAKINPKERAHRQPAAHPGGDLALQELFVSSEIGPGGSPRWWVTLGNVVPLKRPVRADPKMTIGQSHGRPRRCLGAVKIFPSIIPPASSYNRQLMATYEQDLVALKPHMERPAAFLTTRGGLTPARRRRAPEAKKKVKKGLTNPRRARCNSKCGTAPGALHTDLGISSVGARAGLDWQSRGQGFKSLTSPKLTCLSMPAFLL